MRYHPFSHFALKVVSVAVATGLWLMVAQSDQVERGLSIPIELQNLPANLKMVEPPQEAVDVRVRGGSDTLSRLAPGDLVATIDLGAAKAGTELYHISTESVKAPFGVQVTQVAPSTVAIRFEPAAERQLQKVRVELRNLRPGLSARVSPATVKARVRGTEASLGRLRDDEVEAYVDLTGIGPGEYGLAVRLAPASDFGIDQLNPPIVSVQVTQNPRR